MKRWYFLFLLIDWTFVWTRNDVWFGRVFTQAINTFVIDSKAVRSRNLHCSLDIDVYKQHLANGTFWAAQMDDARAKSVGGIFEGDNFHPGHPSQCINTRAPPLNISGRYCLAHAVIRPSYAIDPDFDGGDFARDFPPYNMMLSYWEGLRHKVDIVWHDRNSFMWGLCIPDSCTAEDLSMSLKLVLGAACAQNNISIDIRLEEGDCYTKHEVSSRTVTVGATVWLYTFLVLVALISVGTTYECCLKYEAISEEKRMPKLESLVLPFSLASNIARLAAKPQDGQLAVLHGVKAVAMVILVYGHVGMIRLGNRLSDMAIVEETFRNVASFLTMNGTIVVDTFLLVSGYLTARFLTEHLEKKGSVNILLVYLNRTMRILPIYVTVITFQMYILPLLGEGPRWNKISGRESNRCLQNWWTNLLFVNNFVNPDQMCMVQSWYLTADFQMFVFTAPVICLLFKYPYLKKTVLWGLFTASVFVPSYIVFQEQYWGMFPMITDWFYDPPSVPYYVHFYIQSYARYIPYIVGVSSHFIAVRLTEKSVTFSTAHKFIFFIASFITVMAMFLYVSIRFYASHYQFQLTEQVIYAALHRICWSAVTAGCLVIHLTSGFGVLTDFLSVRLFAVLSRLSFSIYLTHIGLIMYTVSTDHQNVTASWHYFVVWHMGYYLFSVLAAFLLTLTVEMPMEIFWRRAKTAIMEPITSSRSEKNFSSNITIQVPEMKVDVTGEREHR